MLLYHELYCADKVRIEKEGPEPDAVAQKKTGFVSGYHDNRVILAPFRRCSLRNNNRGVVESHVVVCDEVLADAVGVCIAQLA